MAINIGAVKLLLIGCCGALGGGSGYLINWPTKSIGAGKMQVLFKKFDFDNDKTPWTALMAPKSGSDNEYYRPDSEFDKEIVELRKKLETHKSCINSSSSDSDSCKGSMEQIKTKIKEHIPTLRNYCERKESEEITGENLNSMKGYMDICYDMSEMWYFA